jgi:hypothetical protein
MCQSYHARVLHKYMMLVRPHRNHVLYPLMTSIDTTLRHNTYTAYSVPHLLITHDYVITKLVCKYMRHGRKSIAMKLFMRAITELKAMFGFQPPFAYKQSSLGMRQIFKIYQVLLRKTKVIHTPGMSRGHNQISYALNHLV